MPHKPLILVVEDELEICRFLEVGLSANGYSYAVANQGKTALSFCASTPPAAIILDLGLPDMDGKAVIQALRVWSRVPIIVLSARDQEEEKITALQLGADDYLTKPFGMGELIARIGVALRHAMRKDGNKEYSYHFKGLHIDLEKRRAFLNDKQLHLTPTEYDLLAVMVRKAGQVVTQAELLREVWGKDSEENDHYLRIYVQRLRKKVGDDPLAPIYLFTEPGIGYRLSEE